MLPVLKNTLGNITGLLGFIADADKHRPLARGPLGPQIFREPLVRQLNDRIGCRQNGLRGAVVAVQRRDFGAGTEVSRKVEDVAHRRCPERVDDCASSPTTVKPFPFGFRASRIEA